jgi:hypothetical protein
MLRIQSATELPLKRAHIRKYLLRFTATAAAVLLNYIRMADMVKP